MEDGTLPDLRDIELKLGRKVPESLVRSLRGEELVPLERDRDPCGGSSEGGGACSSSSSSCSFPPSLSSSSSSSPTSGSPGRRSHSSTLERLETKLHLLRQEMVSVVRQLWSWGRGPKNAVIGRWGLGERVARAVGLSFRAWEMKGRGAHRGCRSGGSRCEACLPRTLLGSGFAKIAACSVCVLYDSADSVLPCSDHFVAPGPPPPPGGLQLLHVHLGPALSHSHFPFKRWLRPLHLLQKYFPVCQEVARRGPCSLPGSLLFHLCGLRPFGAAAVPRPLLS